MADDTTLSPLDPAQWDASLAPVLADMKGNPLNVHRLMAHHPALLSAWWNFRNHSVNGGALGRRNGELVILRVGLLLGAWYEWSAHVDRALACGMSLAEIERVKDGPDATGWSPADAALLRAVDTLYHHRRLDPATEALVRTHFTVPQVMDIMAIGGMYVILGNMINTWGLPLDPGLEERLPPGVTEADFEAAARKV